MTEHGVAAIRDLAGLATPMALRVAVTLGLPDRLRGDGAAVDQLATEHDVSAVALELLLGHLAALRIVERTPIGTTAATGGVFGPISPNIRTCASLSISG